MNILLVGKGPMAQAVADLCGEKQISCLRIASSNDWPQDQSIVEKSVVTHFGSGRLLPWLIKMCASYERPLIQGSTGVQTYLSRRGWVINAPNLSLPMVRFMVDFPPYAQSLIELGAKLSIIESHQSTKKDVSGTARAIAKSLDQPVSIIRSIRDPKTQQMIGVPAEYLDGHAYHDFSLSCPGGEVIISSTRIHGRRPYAHGALAVAKAIVDPKCLDRGVHQLKDIIDILPISE